jgi:hypothetical protein
VIALSLSSTLAPVLRHHLYAGTYTCPLVFWDIIFATDHSLTLFHWYNISNMHLIRWISARLGLEPIKRQVDCKSVTSERSDINFDNMAWPEGLHIRKEVRFNEPAGWAHTSWAWRSTGYVDRPGSLYPKYNKAESRYCLGVLRCQVCGLLVRPRTKTAEMKSQLANNCPVVGCGNALQQITCGARIYHFVMEEDHVEYSIWEHEGFHSSHPHPPSGRQPAHIIHTPSQTIGHSNISYLDKTWLRVPYNSKTQSTPCSLEHEAALPPAVDPNVLSNTPAMTTMTAVTGASTNAMLQVAHADSSGASTDAVQSIIWSDSK